MYENFIGKDVQILVAFAFGGLESMNPISYYGTLIDVNDKTCKLSLSFKRIERQQLPMPKKLPAQGMAIFNLNFVISITQQQPE